MVFRSTRRSTSSVGRVTPSHRSRSLSTLSPRPKHDPAIQMSQIRDHDLKTTIEAQVQRLARSLTKRKTDEDSARSRVRRSRSYGRRYEEDIEMDSDEWQQMPSASHGDWARHTLAPYSIDKSVSSAALQQKATRLLLKDAIDADTLPTGRTYERISAIAEQLRREDAGAGSASVRSELDSFASLISKLSPGSAAGLSRPVTSSRSDAEDFWTRLAHTRGDLAQLETLVGRTFGSSHLHAVGNSPPASVDVEPIFIFHDKKPSSRRDDVTAFITGDSADYKRSDAIAEMAIKWAQERREKLDNELHGTREYEDHPRHLHTHLRTARHEDEYVQPYDLERTAAATAVIHHTSPTLRYQRAATVDLHGTSSREPRGYTRSESASVTGHQRADDKHYSEWHPSRISTSRPPMSAARQRARSVLAKHGRHMTAD